VNEIISETLRWLLLFSIYILIVGGLFMALRALLHKLTSNTITVYKLWLIFPVGIVLLAALQGLQPQTLSISEVLTLQPLVLTTLATAPSVKLDWQISIFLVWIIVASILLSNLFVKYIALKRALLNCDSGQGENIYESNAIVAPIAFGFLSPKVYIPGAFSELFTPKQQQLILAHEQTHCTRYDPTLRLIYKVFNCIFWFHPIFYWLNQAMKNDQEISCDQIVIQHQGEPLEYSKLLLSINQTLHSTASKLSPTTTTSELYCSSISLLKERIQMIDKLHPAKRAISKPWLGGAILVICSLWLDDNDGTPCS